MGARTPNRTGFNVDDPKRCPELLPDSPFINFYYIRDLYANFQSVEHHYFSTKPPSHLLTETQDSEISILGDFNVHYRLSLSSNFMDPPREQTFNFAANQAHFKSFLRRKLFLQRDPVSQFRLGGFVPYEMYIKEK